MQLKSPLAFRFELPLGSLKEFYCPQLTAGFLPNQPLSSFCRDSEIPALFTIDLYKTLDRLHNHEMPKPLEKENCSIPVLLYISNFSLDHLLFHYDGTPSSADLIRHFLWLFGNLIGQSRATIISPSFIPKSKIREEQDIIHLVSQSTRETSFIKFNFLRIGDFWSYGVKHDCTLLVTTKNYQSDLAKVLFHFYRGKMWSDQLSFYLSV